MKTNFVLVARARRLIVSIFLVGALTSCTYSEPQELIQFKAFLPDASQISISPTDLPASLSLLHHYPVAKDQKKAAQYQDLLLKNRPLVYMDQGNGTFKPIISSTHDRTNFSFENNNSLNDDIFDPFFLGSPNNPVNQVDSQCGDLNGDPTGLDFNGGFGNGMCTYGVIKIALHDALTRYNEFHRIIIDIVESLGETNAQPNVIHEFTNSSVKTFGANGILIAIYYGNCSDNTDYRIHDTNAVAFCEGQASSAIYHRTVIYPITAYRPFTQSSILGKMEWLQYSDKSMFGKISISKGIMTDAHPNAPSQMQFEFRADSAQKFQSFTIKKPTPIIDNSYEYTFGADIIELSKIGNGAEALWVVRGNIMYEFWYGRNPIRYKLLNGVGTDEYFFHNVQKRAYFVAVAEDAFMGNRNDPASGRSVFKVIVAEDGTGTTLDLRGALDPSTWDKEFHLWAAYKKILKTQYDARHYLVSHGMSEAPVKVWKHDTASEYSFPARGYDQSVYSDWGNMSVTADGSRYIIFKDNRLQVLGENTRPTGIYGETEDILVLLGECDPFEGSGATSRRAVTHPTDSRLVLVGDGRSEYSYDYFRQGSSYVPYGTHEARVIDISNIQSGVCPVHNAHQFVHPVLDTFLGTHIAGFSPDGTKVLTWGNTYIPITLGPTFASYELRLNFWVWDISSNTLVHSAQIPLRPNEPGLKTQEGSVLALDSTSTKVLGENYKGANWVYDMETGGTLYLQGATRTNNRAMYNTFFHPQGFNQVIQTMDADSGTIDGVSVTFPPRLYRWNLDAWDSTQAITEWYVHTAIPRQLLQTEDREYVSGQGDGKISYAFLSGDKNQIALTSAQGRNPTGQFEFYSFRPTGEIISRPKRFYTQFVGVHASASGIDYQPVQNPVNNKVFFIYPSGLNGTLETILLNLEADPDLDSGFTYVHDGRVNTVTFSKDDNYILSGGSDGKAAIWTAIQGDLVITLEGHSDEVTRAVFTHDGKGVATSSLDGTALLWDTDINSTGWGTVRQTLTGHTGPINLIDYDNNFNRHRYATAGDDGSIHIYEETGSTTVFSNLFMDAGIPQPVSYVDFSHDGRYLVAGGKTATNNIVVIDTDPDVLYNGQAYNLLGSLTIHQNFVNSVMFFPGDNTRIFSAGEDTTSRVNTLSYTPNGTNPPLVSATQRVQIDTFSTRAYVTNQWHGLIVGRLCVNSGSCYDAPQITHWDLNEGATEGLQFSASTAPIGPRRYIDNTGQMQNRGILYWAEANSDGTRVVGAHQGSNQFDPRWVEFDEWFNEPDPERPGLPLRPDEGEEVNYYYTESATSSSANADQACYIWDIAARTCATSCLAVGGCDGYTVKSQWQYTQDGTAPPTGSFMRLLVEMGRLEQDTYPDTWGYNLDSFVAEPLL